MLAGGILAAYDGISVEDFEAQADEFLRGTQHPTLGRGYLEMRVHADGRAARLPRGQRVHELHRLRRRARLHAPDQRGDVRHPARAGDRQQRRARLRERRHGGTITHKPEADYLDDGPEKPMRIWSRTGRRPLLAAGNSNGDIPMLEFTQHPDKPSLRLLVLHDDAEREFAYTAGAEQALERRPATAGPSSASRTTGRPCSEPRMARRVQAGDADARSVVQRSSSTSPMMMPAGPRTYAYR